jgi:hypothetical protein
MIIDRPGMALVGGPSGASFEYGGLHPSARCSGADRLRRHLAALRLGLASILRGPRTSSPA